MLEVVAIIWLLATCYIAISLTVGMFNTRMFQAMKGYKADVPFLIKAYVPFANLSAARKLLYGRTLYTALLGVCGVLAVFRIVSLALVAQVPVLVTYSAVGMIICTVMYYVLYIANAVTFSRLLQCGAGITAVCVILPMVGYYMLAVHVLPYFKREEDKLSGRFEAHDQLQ